MSGPIETHDILIRLIDGSTILDVGSGWGRVGYFLLTNWYYSKNKTLLPNYSVGVDIFAPSLKRLKRHRIYDDLILCDARYLPFRAHSFQVVSATEIVEHMDKRDAFSAIKEIERVSEKTVIITTPHYPGHRGGIQLSEGFNPYERHISSISYKDFIKLGYKVYGKGFAVGFKFSYVGAVGSHYPKFVLFMGELLSALSILFPQLASVYIAKKHIRKTK
jgi:hypothetical protein